MQRINKDGDMNNQCRRLLKLLNAGMKITQLDSYKLLGIMRLASRICELKKAGYNIKREMIPVNNRFDEEMSIAEYRLEKDDEHTDNG